MFKNGILIVLLVACSSCCMAQETGCFTETANNEVVFDAKIDLSPYNGFFIGEVHVDGRQGMKLALLKYLNKQFGVTDVFMELGYNAAFLYNQYLATGDSTLVDLRYNQWYKTAEDKKFWKDIYEYNKTLDKKIVIYGMDYENAHFYKTLYMLMPKGKEKPAKILKALTKIEKSSTKRHMFARPSYIAVKKNILNNMELYKQYYGDNFRTVADVMFNPTNIESAVAYAKRNGSWQDMGTIIYRDSTMCMNINKQTDRHAIKKFIVFVGLMHGNGARKNSLYANMKNANANDRYANIALTFKNSNVEAKHENKYRYLIAVDKDHKEVSYDKNYAILEQVYEQYFNRGCKYTMINTNSIKTEPAAALKSYADYLMMMEGQW